ncbi:profilin [Mycena albidolilacea]|uniref:Profilin n=1 Tax=Mycena albidolilacea TaxID=1033008 RepID=A0AAD6ZAA6_9AGAR|nr:profilin [Mycena albidolilacea]
MSWQAYVDTNLVGTGTISKAAILGQQGGVWAASPGYNLSTEEQNAVVNAFKNLAGVQTSGLHLAGVKFFTTTTDERTINGKKGGDGYVIVKTVQAIIVAEYAPPIQAQEAAKVVQGLADYLVGAGY